MTESDDNLMQYLNRCSITEESIINPLLASSNKFKIFYDSERGKISQLMWLDAEKFYGKGRVPEGYVEEYKELSNGIKAIILAKFPMDKNDASVIAHELAHAVFRVEGFPFIGHKQENHDAQKLGMYFGEMIHEPLVIKKLQRFGYYLRQEYIDECVEIRGLQKMEYSGINKIMVTFLFVQIFLEQDLLFIDKNNPCCEVLRELGKQHSDTMAKAKKIFEYIKQTGLDTPQQVNDIIKKVREMYPEISGLIKIY